MTPRAVLPAARSLRRAVVISLAATVVTLALPGVSWGVAVPGTSGIDTSLPLTDSKLTVSGRAPFSDLRITVNQTAKLANQAISVTWTGGSPTLVRGVLFGEHFLQMFQCWGDDDGSHPENPGPPPEQCQQGATNGVFGGRTSLLGQINAGTLSRATSEPGAFFKPFRAVDGTVVPEPFDRTYTDQVGAGGAERYWLNPYFNVITTNEVAGSRTAPNGTGSELFEASTGLESTGLGCGKQAQKLPDGTSKIPRCWLVVVPRGSAVDENAGTVAPTEPVSTSPLAPLAWKNRIAIPLEFNPLDSSCPLSAEQRRLVGSELLSAAVSSWQPTLCATPGLPPYAFGSISDSLARQQLVRGGPGAPGMAVVGRPVDPETVDPTNPVVYSPLTLSGSVIGFNIERVPRTPLNTGEATVGEELRGIRVAQLNLTPRLVAKLLTQSYRSQVEILSSVPPYPWSSKNPNAMQADPDFLQFNPEFEILQIAFAKNLGGLVLPSPKSDASRQVWEWVLADPEAKAWLADAPDPWGMRVNPAYSTSASVNPQGAAFGDPVPEDFPKSDSYCYQGPVLPPPSSVTPPPLCGLDWLPYAQGLRDAAKATRAANDNAKAQVNSGALSADQVYKSEGPQTLGTRSILSITDTAAASKFGVQMARLSRAGDNAADRQFIAPDQAGLAAGAAALGAKTVPDFLEPDPSTTPPGAYPLTALTYAAVTPLRLDEAARKEYAAFVEYAARPGQERGLEYGKLPPGYEPLPEPLRVQGVAAGAVIRSLKPEAAEEASAEAGADDEADEEDEEDEGSASDGESTSPSEAEDEAANPTSGPAGSGSPVLPVKSDPPKKSIVKTIADVVATPIYKLAATRFALPTLVVVALLAALGALELSKRRTRRGAGAGDDPLPVTGGGGSGDEDARVPTEGGPER